MNIPVWDDVKDFLNETHEAWWKRYREARLEDVVLPLQSPGGNGKTDGSGNLTLPIYQNRTERTLLIGRIFVNADGYTPATTYTNAAAYAYIFTGVQFGGAGQVYDFLPNSPGGQVFPQLAEYSSRNALRLMKNETLSMYLVGGPVSTNVYSFIYGELLPPKLDRQVV